MGASAITSVLIAVLCCTNFGGTLKVNPDVMHESNARCAELAKDPDFDIYQIVGKSWRIYYTWNLSMANKCLDMTFRNATPKIVKRIFTDMNEYLEVQPNWHAATLHVSMGSANHEMLLFADQGAAGSFLAVPNIIRGGNMSPIRGGVPILSFFIKLLHGDKYLLMADCKIGVMSLCSREKPPYRTEVASVVSALNMGKGDPACISEKREDEILGTED